MNFNKINELLNNLNEQLNFLELEEEDTILKSEKSLEIIIGALQQLKSLVTKSNFRSQKQEIFFFKTIKPQFTSKLIFHNSVYKIETKKPFGGDRVVLKYYRNELLKIKRYFDSNIDFYKYYRTGSIYLDYKYFVRGRFDVKLILESFYFEADNTFSTSHDFKVAKILAHDLLEVYLENRLVEVANQKKSPKLKNKKQKKIYWTAPKVSLVELLYALNSAGVFNNGALDLKDLADHFEEVFEIDLGQYRRVFLEIRQRKIQPTKFLDALKDALQKRMNDAED